MAILGMKRLTLVAHQDSRDKLLKNLQKLGAVEVIQVKLEGLAEARQSTALTLLEARYAAVREALETLRPYDTNKPSFLTPKPPISRTDLETTAERFAEADEDIAKIKAFADDLNAVKARRQRLKNRIIQLMPYIRLDMPLQSVSENKYTVCLLGTIPDDAKEKYAQIVLDYTDSAYFQMYEDQKDASAVFVVMHKSVQEKLTGELKYIGFSEAFTKDLIGTPADIIADCESELLSLDEETKEYEDKARSYVAYKPLLTALEDYLANEIERARCVDRLGETGSAFALEGWVIAEAADSVEKAVLMSAPEAYVHFRDPEDGEIPPTVLKNPRVIQPFEAVTDMYAVPSSRGFDPNAIMAFFYFIVFGMMVGDFAYGVILTLGAFMVLKLKKPSGMFRRITTVVMYCGISTALWGLFFGTIFSIEGVPYVLSPLQDADGAMATLGLCLGIGVLHILTGLGIGAYMDIKRGHFFAAIFDRVSWMLVIVGGIMVLVGGSIGNVGSYLAIAGVLILLFTQGRSKKGVVKKVMGGLSSLYGVTSYVSDILSYCRIFGMGLATTVIAMVFNTIAGLMMGGVAGYIFGIVILTVGHVFNIAINALGAFVHSARLQYIEFFNKFYEGDGHAFMPLGIRTKHHRLMD